MSKDHEPTSGLTLSTVEAQALELAFYSSGIITQEDADKIVTVKYKKCPRQIVGTMVVDKNAPFSIRLIQRSERKGLTP